MKNLTFSKYVKDLFYTVSHIAVMKNVKDCIINDKDETAFVSRCAFSVESFFDPLSLYLLSAFVGKKKKSSSTGPAYLLAPGSL